MASIPKNQEPASIKKQLDKLIVELKRRYPAGATLPATLCAQTDTLERKTFVVTGDLLHYENRDALKAAIEAHGGKLSGSVSSKTTALITNFPDSGTTKIAVFLGVPYLAGGYEHNNTTRS